MTLTQNRVILKNTNNGRHWLVSDMQYWKCGTCKGLWIIEPDRLLISAVQNECPHNGHFKTFMKRIEKKAKDENKDLYFISFMNPRLKEHLIKQGYEETTVIIKKDGEITDGVVKHFKA